MAGSTPSPALLWRMTRPAFLLLTVVACLSLIAGAFVPMPY